MTRPQTADAGVQPGSHAAPSEGIEPHRRRLAAIAIRLQRDAIVRHRGELSHRLGRAVTLDEAARDWIPNYAEHWRSAYMAASHAPIEVSQSSDFTSVVARPN